MLSLIIIGRDVDLYVADCLESVANSDTRDYEVVFVDDGSVDETPRIVESFRQRLPALTVLRHAEPKGLAGARNSGLHVVDGDLVSFLDGDDWLGPHAITEMSRALRETDADFLRVDHVRVDGTKRSVHRAPEWRREEVLDPRTGIGSPARPSMVDYPYTWAGAFQRRLLEQGLLDQDPNLKTAEDRPWIWRLHLRAASYVVSGQLGHFYRRGIPHSLSQTGDERQLDYLKAFASVLDIVQGDRQAAEILTKAWIQFLAVAHSHIARESRLSPTHRAEHRRRLRSFLIERNALDHPAIARNLGETRLRVLQDVIDDGGSRQ